jgi:hypothetical protein
MESADKQDVAALMAGIHNLFALLVRRGALQGTVDIAEMLIELDQLLEIPGQHPLTVAVEEDAKELLLQLLARGPRGAPVAIEQAEIERVSPARQ